MKSPDHRAAELLRSVVRPPARDGRFVELAGEIPCWQETLDIASFHGVSPLLYARLLASGADIPPEAMDRLRNEFERNAFHCMTNTAELLEILGQFATAGIAAMPFKGVVLGASAYGDMARRVAGDLDVLVHFRDLERATEILKGRGYALKTELRKGGLPEMPDYFEYHFERPEDGMVLELRWRLELTQRFRRDLGMEWIWPRRRALRLAGTEVPNLDPVSSLLVLCMHGSKHTWSRLIWICDVARLLESEPGLDWEFAIAEAKRVGLWRCLALGVILARRAAEAEVPEEILRGFEADRAVQRLADSLERTLLEDPEQMPDGRVPYSLQVLDFRDRALALLSPSILRPGDRDREFVRLPKALTPLYYLIKPVRLLLDRGGR